MCITRGKISKCVLDPGTAPLHKHHHSLSNMHTKWKMGLTGNMFLKTAVYGCAKVEDIEVKQRTLSLHLQPYMFFIMILYVF